MMIDSLEWHCEVTSIDVKETKSVDVKVWLIELRPSRYKWIPRRKPFSDKTEAQLRLLTALATQGLVFRQMPLLVGCITSWDRLCLGLDLEQMFRSYFGDKVRLGLLAERKVRIFGWQTIRCCLPCQATRLLSHKPSSA